MEIFLPSITIHHKFFFSLTKTPAFHRPSTNSTKPHHYKVVPHKQNTLQIQDFQQNWTLKRTLFEKLKHKDSNPVQILEQDGDWSKDLFWAVVGFLNQTSKSNHVLQVFEKWTSNDDSRVSVFNYERIVRLLVEEGLIEDAILGLNKIKGVYGVKSCLEIYDMVIFGLVKMGQFDDALVYLKEMEDNEMKASTAVYNVLIRAYAENGLYDDMAKCVKRMEVKGCFPDQCTYNLLIRTFSSAGLIKRMEKTYRIVISKRMDVEDTTMVAMLEAYANFGDVEKMDKVYRRVLRLKPRVYLSDDLIRKVAVVYIENYMFSKLEDMGINLYSKSGNNDIVWCLRLLSHACLLSRTGMKSVVREMEYKKVKWSVTIANIMLFAYAKMKDFERFDVVLLEMADRKVKPDIVTCGILSDAHGWAVDRAGELGSWRKMGFFRDVVELKTDPLVLAAFGKGDFLKTVEELDQIKSKDWTYEHLIKTVNQHQHRKQIKV
uniref:pentatricopeptide repeat-containing protein At4g14190, chloroplastic n=1 Tax=Erigeron canadensis TaxID=72917 RepID=UPI001CB8EA78|nr:pentatricopeptide repeat-containing protein At4g14190, chloroplastic [Erigeron canadensis]